MVNLPTLSELYNSIKTDLEAQFGVTIPNTGKNFLRVKANVLAAKLWLYYKLLGDVQKNAFPDTAYSDATGGTLEAFGRMLLNRNPFQSTAGIYTATVTGQTGATIAANSTFKSNDGSLNPAKLFTLDSAYIMPGTTGTITLRALTPGLEAQLSIGDKLTATAPIANVDSIVTILTETTEPQAAEDLEIYRQRILERYRLRPQGGAGSDYRLWANEVQSVRQSYPFVSSTEFHDVNLYVEATIADSTDGKGTPSVATLNDVKVSIEDATVDRPSRKPITDKVFYNAINPLDVAINIANFQSLTTPQQTSISTAIEAALFNIRPFVASIDPVSRRNDTINTNLLIGLILQAVPGATFGAVTFTVDASTSISYTFEQSVIPFLDQITYV
jgi:hypothetical protein